MSKARTPIVEVPLFLIRSYGSRDQAKIEYLRKRIEQGYKIRPIRLTQFDASAYKIRDGRHRFDAVRKAGWLTIPAYID